MKKRMLVTTIALVLVIAVALTTSSLAWFTSSSSVTAGSITFTANTATGANLVLGNLGERNLSIYDTEPVTLPGGTGMEPAQGNPALGTLIVGTPDGSEEDNDFTVANNQISYIVNPFLKAENVRQTEGFAVEDQKVNLVTGGKYLAGGFNYANATGDALTNGVTVKVTITLAKADAEDAATDGKVNKGFIAYDGGAWYSAGQEVTASAVFFNSVDVALLASIRIAMFGAANVVAGETTFGAPTIYEFNDTGVVLKKNGYAVGAAGSNNKYVTAADDDVTMPTTDKYAETITPITVNAADVATGTFVISVPFNAAINAGDAGSIAYVIWMDGWDESALPGVSKGTFGMNFTVSVG